MSAETPGQAAYEAYWDHAAEEFGGDLTGDDAPAFPSWDGLAAWQQRAAEAGAQAAAARERRALKALNELIKIDSDPASPWNQRAMKIIARGLADDNAAQEPHAADGDAPAIVDGIVKEWLDRRTATALATAPGIDDREQGKRQGIEQLRYLHLDDYWYVLTPAILAALGKEPQPAPELAAERDGLRKALRAISLGIAEPSPQSVARDALNGRRYFDPDTDAGVWSMSDPAEQVRLARQDRDQLRTAVLSLAADLEESAARTAPSKKSSIESEIAIHLRKTAEPPA